MARCCRCGFVILSHGGHDVRKRTKSEHLLLTERCYTKTMKSRQKDGVRANLTEMCDAWNVQRVVYNIAGVSTAIYCPDEPDARKPNILLIHGLNGSWRGMKQLGFLLRKQYNVYFVDLPGHGASSVPTFSIREWSQWIEKLLPSGMLIGGGAISVQIDRVVAHSFGCYVAAALKQYHPALPTIYLMPVLSPSRFMRVWSGVMKLLTPVMVATYNIEIWASLRGFVLCHRRTRDSWRIMRWSSAAPHASREQLRYQISIMRMLPSYVLPDAKRDTIIVGKFDTVESVDVSMLQRNIRQSTIVAFPGGHIAPIEQADELARVILEECN